MSVTSCSMRGSRGGERPLRGPSWRFETGAHRIDDGDGDDKSKRGNGGGFLGPNPRLLAIGE
jgi:hypothetical protein